MAGRGRKCAAVTTKGATSTGSMTKRTRQVDESACDDSAGKQKPKRTLGLNKKKPTRVSPRRGKAATAPPVPEPSPSKSSRPKKVSTKDAVNQAQEYPESNVDDEPAENTSTQVGRVKKQIRQILEVSKKLESHVIQGQGVAEEGEDEILDDDSDDVLSDDGGVNVSQLTMDGDKDYNKHPVFDAEELPETDEEEDHFDLSRMRMVPEKVDIYNDPSKSHEQWWTEDPTREETLCQLWSEEPTLFVVKSEGHRIPSNRETILRKFSTILQMPPHIIYTRMGSIRNHFQKMHREAPSGSEPVGKTPRQKEILRLAYFLRQHIKTTDTVTSYSGRSPANPNVYSYQKKTVTPRKCAPANKSAPKISTPVVEQPKRTFKDLQRKVNNIKVVMELNEIMTKATPKNTPTLLSTLMENSLTPIQDNKQLTGSEAGSDMQEGCEVNVEDEKLTDDDQEEELSHVLINQKHFARNDRLHDQQAVSVSAKRSLRLTHTPKKTTDTSKIKSSKKKSSSGDPTLHKASRPGQSDDNVSSCSVATVASRAPSISVDEGSKKGTSAKPLTALERYRQTKINLPSKDNSQISLEKHPSQIGKEERHVAKKSNKQTMLNVKPKSTGVTHTGRCKENVVDTEDSSAVEDQSYDMGIEVPWYDKQGPAYRKMRDEAAARKRRAAEQDPLVGIMKEKNETFKKLTESLDLIKKPESTKKSSSEGTGAEQLFADSLVPQLLRMSQETRDVFMEHVISLAFKAIRGKWPTDD